MARNTLPKNGKGTPYTRLDIEVRRLLPQLYSHLVDMEDFREVRVYVRGDGDFLGILKGYDSDGGEIILFGGGFDVMSCLIGLEGAVAGNKWRKDKPYGKA